MEQPPKQRANAGRRVARNGLLRPLHVLERDGRYVIAPVGELDASTVGSLAEAISTAEQSAAKEIVVDLSQLTFMDSSGLRLLLEAHARSQKDSDRFRLVRGPRRVQRVFELTGMESRLPFIDR